MYSLNGLAGFETTVLLWKPCGNSFIEKDDAHECFFKPSQAAGKNTRNMLIIMVLFVAHVFCVLFWRRGSRKGDFGHLHRFAAAGLRMSTAFAQPQLILVVGVTVPGATRIDSSADVDARQAEVYSQASGGRSLRGGLSAATFL